MEFEILEIMIEIGILVMGLRSILKLGLRDYTQLGIGITGLHPQITDSIISCILNYKDFTILIYCIHNAIEIRDCTPFEIGIMGLQTPSLQGPHTAVRNVHNVCNVRNSGTYI